MLHKQMIKVATAAFVAAVLAMAPAESWAQRRGSSAGGGRSGGGGVSGGGSGGGGATAVPRGGDRSGGGSGGGGGRTASAPAGTSGDSGGTARRRGADNGANSGQTVGRAVPRERGGYSGGGGGTTVIVPGYYGGWAPWAWGGFGFGYYGGYWDPWFYGGAPYYDGGAWVSGALRLKVDPRDASVFVDGYYAGEVDQFDGVFQRLKLEPGPHRIEISADGYETLAFDINVMPDRTTTYKGELNRIQ